MKRKNLKKKKKQEKTTHTRLSLNFKQKGKNRICKNKIKKKIDSYAGCVDFLFSINYLIGKIKWEKRNNFANL